MRIEVLTAIAISLFCVLVLVDAQAADKAKVLPSNQPFEDAIKWIRCDVCVQLVSNSYNIVDALKSAAVNAERSGGQYVAPPREEDVLEALETVCNPFSESGWWIRYWGIQTLNSGYEARLEPLKDYMKCKRHCATVAEACDKIHQSSAMDRLPGLLFKLKQTKGSLQSELCRSECRARDDLVEQLNAKGPTKRLSAEIEKEKHEVVEEKEMDVEEMIDRMGRTRVGGSPKMDVFSRDTITEMQAAITHGTKEQAAMYDPHVNDLTDEEFLELQEMFKNEKGHEYPTAPDFGDTESKQVPKKDSTSDDSIANEEPQQGKKKTAKQRLEAAEAEIMARIDKMSDEEVLALIKQLEDEEKKKKPPMSPSEDGEEEEGDL